MVHAGGPNVHFATASALLAMFTLHSRFEDVRLARADIKHTPLLGSRQ